MDILRSIFFPRVHTRGTMIFVCYVCAACVICTYNWNRIIACGIVGQTRSNCIYSHNPTQTNTNYYYHQSPVIFRSNSNAIHNLTTLLFIIFSIVHRNCVCTMFTKHMRITLFLKVKFDHISIVFLKRIIKYLLITVLS